MHISEGILSGPVLISGAAIAVAGTVIGLKKLDYDRIPQAGILAASFFVASLVHVPLAAASVHLILNGLIGLILGWGAFPVILVALALQAVFFQYGGITTLGVNTVIMALPAVLCGLLFRRMVLRDYSKAIYVSFFCGSGSVLLAAIIMASALFYSGEAFFEISLIVVAAHIPVMVIEGVVTAFCISFLKKVQPSLLGQISASSTKNQFRTP